MTIVHNILFSCAFKSCHIKWIFFDAVEPMWREILWRLRPRCWRTGAGRRNLYRGCPNTTKQGRQSLTTCWTNWSKAGSLTLACLTCVRSCWECLTRPSTHRKRSDTALVAVFVLINSSTGGSSIFVENQFSWDSFWCWSRNFNIYWSAFSNDALYW